MKNTLIALLASTTIAFSANATTLDSFFYKNGYTKPESIVSIQAKVDSGEYYNYPYIVGGGVEKGLFKDKLKKGTALPQIQNVAALKRALDKKQVVLVASNGGDFTSALPIFVEIAKQNGVATTDLMAHLTINEADGEDFFSNIDDVLDTVQSKIDEISTELNDEVNEEIATEVAQEIAQEITEEVTKEITEEVAEEVEAEISYSIDEALATLGYETDTFASGFDDLVSEINENLGAAAAHIDASEIAGRAIAEGINRDLGTDFTPADVVGAVDTYGG